MTPYIAPGLTKIMLVNFRSSLDFYYRFECIESIICEYYQIPKRVLISKSRKDETVEARHLTAFFAKQFTSMTWKKIGTRLGGRDHTTAIHSVQAIRDRMDTEPPFKEEVQKLSEQIARKIYGK